MYPTDPSQQLPPQQQPPQGYGPPPAYGYQYPPQYGGMAYGPQEPRRPGIATGAGVCGIVVGVGSFGYSTGALIAAAGLTDEGNAPSHMIAVTWIVGILAVFASVSTFVGSIQLLTGKSPILLRLGCAAAIVAIWTAIIYVLAQFDEAIVTFLIIGIVASITPIVVLCLSLSRDIVQWRAKRAAWRAAGGS